LSLDKSHDGWEWVKAKDFMIFNPKESVKKGTVIKNVPMDKIEPKTKEISNYEITEYKGGVKFRNGDTLMARITPCLENGKISQVSILDYNEIGAGSTEFIVLREKEGVSDKDFIYYLSNSEYFKEPAIKSMVGSSGRQRVQRDVVENLDIYVPPLNTQKKIGKLLSLFDQKISLNKKINNHLEEIILEIFDRWFVKFELSDELKSSKLGLIPKGWDIDYLGSKKSCTIIGSGIRNFEDSKIYIATADVDNSIITYNENLITMEDKPSRANMQPVPKSIWFAKMIDSRKLIMVDEYSSELLDNYIFSTGFCGLKCVDKYFYYLWTFLLTDAFNTMKNNFCTGTTMQAINNKDTKLIEFVLPDDNLLSQFNSIAEPIFKEIYYNNNEIKKLQNLRDILLPKLMSGEIDVAEINYDLKKIIRKFILSFLNYLWRQLYENKNYFKNTKSNETLLEPRPIHKINKLFTKFIRRYRYNRQQY